MTLDRRTFLQIAAGIGATAVYAPRSRARSGVFRHGVASGDPLSDRVILWTRVHHDTTQLSIPVRWSVARDASMSQIVMSGAGTASADQDYCFKLDVIGLEPGETYYYRFEALGERSEVGRTRTLPVGALDVARFAVVSCSNYPAGYFNVYREIAKRDDLDAVLHLGDYIYEYAIDGYASEDAAMMNRLSDPVHEIVSLSDYRRRYAQYRSDADLQAVHAAHPMIAVWDDHEITNNAWRYGAENHQSDTEGAWDARRQVAIRAYHEWMPIRTHETGAQDRIFRAFAYGDLLTLAMLDTRHFGRDEQLEFPADPADVAALNAARGDEGRTLLGQAQERWLEDVLRTSQTRWRMVGQQVLLNTLQAPPGLSQVINVEAGGRWPPQILGLLEARAAANMPLVLDTWDGYLAARERLLDVFADLDGPVVTLTGDIHTAMAGVARHPRSGAPVSAEFVTPAVTSPGLDYYLPPREAGGTAQAFLAHNDNLAFMEGTLKGWVEVEITADAATAQWRFVDTVLNTDYAALDGPRFQAPWRPAGEAELNPG